jgi:DNA-binding CsgD family transcriptional regulator/PAS domain-containing protein
MMMGSRVTRLNAEQLSSIIGDIYDCVLDPGGWVSVLNRITRTTDSAYTTITLASAQDSHGRFAAHSPWDAEQMRVLQVEYGFQDIPGLMPAVVGDLDTPLTTLSCLSEPELRATRFYREWAEPQGLREGCMVKFVDTDDRLGLLGTTIYADRDVISSEEQRFLALLAPHLRRAALIGDLLDQARVMAHFYRETLGALSTSIVFTDAEGRLLYANASAERMLSAEAPILSRNGVLQSRNPAMAGALLTTIAAASNADVTLGARGIGLPISAPGETPAVAYVLPLTAGTARAVFRPARAAVFVSTTISTTPIPLAVLMTLFDLTPAEARVLLAVGRGAGAAAAARALGIGENTLKTHLNRIYAKTGTSRQPDLVKLIADIGAPLAVTGLDMPTRLRDDGAAG